VYSNIFFSKKQVYGTRGKSYPQKHHIWGYAKILTATYMGKKTKWLFKTTSFAVKIYKKFINSTFFIQIVYDFVALRLKYHRVFHRLSTFFGEFCGKLVKK